MKTVTAIENQVNRVSKKVYADIVSRVPSPSAHTCWEWNLRSASLCAK